MPIALKHLPTPDRRAACCSDEPVASARIKMQESRATRLGGCSPEAASQLPRYVFLSSFRHSWIDPELVDPKDSTANQYRSSALTKPGRR